MKIDLIIPKITASASNSDREGVFVIEPFEHGFGVTIGNSLRRVLLGALPGVAVMKVRILGEGGVQVLHEFDSVEGVKEDVCEIILNLKGVVAKFETGSGFASIDVSGPQEITAGDIRCGADLEILNPEHHIATIAEGARLRMELTFAQGRGYVSSEKNKKAQSADIIGDIFTDSIYTPVLSVSYSIENTRVGDITDFDRLILNVKTNGVLTPEEALADAAHILVAQFTPFIERGTTEIAIDTSGSDDAKSDKLLGTLIEELDLSVRSFNALKRAGINSIDDLSSKSIGDMMKIRNLGQKSFDEIRQKLHSFGLDFKEDLELL